MKHSSASTSVTGSSRKSFRISRPEIMPRTKEVLNILVEADILFVFKVTLMQIWKFPICLCSYKNNTLKISLS